MALWLAYICFPCVISVTFSNYLSQLKITGNCSQKAGNAILDTSYLKISRGIGGGGGGAAAAVLNDLSPKDANDLPPGVTSIKFSSDRKQYLAAFLMVIRPLMYFRAKL